MTAEWCLPEYAILCGKSKFSKMHSVKVYRILNVLLTRNHQTVYFQIKLLSIEQGY